MSEKATLDGYRQAVTGLVQSLVDHEATMLHIGRSHDAGAVQELDRLHQVRRELWKQLRAFEAVEPGKWLAVYRALGGIGDGTSA